MLSRSTLTEVALDYLRAVAKVLENKIGRNPRHVQQSTWMVKTSPTGRSSQNFTREIFDISKASMVYQTTFLHANPPAQQRLIKALVTAGIEPQESHYGFLSPLVHHWLKLEDPFAFNEENTNKMFDEFNAAVIGGSVITKSRSTLLLLDLKADPISLRGGVTIRPISANELWELGETNVFSRLLIPPSAPFYLLGEDWKILDIEIQHRREQVHPPDVIQTVHEASLTALALVSSGHMQVYDWGTTVNYGMGAVGIVRTGGQMPREIGRWGGKYVLDKEASQRIKDLWPHLRRIMESERHYLRIPAKRLADGGGRFREDDAIIDYAIGLEALLLKGVPAELSYRFAIRGATILAWDSGEKQRFFKQLQDFYKIRSRIVHGGQVDAAKLRDAQSSGEKALRDIWWWCFNNKEDLSHILVKVDRAIVK